MAGKRQTRTVKVLGIVVRCDIRVGKPVRRVRHTPGDAPTHQVSRSLFKRSSK